MKTKAELIKDIAYWLDLMYIPKYSCMPLNVEINAGLSITAVSRTRITFKKTRQNYINVYDVNMSSKEITTNILQMILDSIINKYK